MNYGNWKTKLTNIVLQNQKRISEKTFIKKDLDSKPTWNEDN